MPPVEFAAEFAPSTVEALAPPRRTAGSRVLRALLSSPAGDERSGPAELAAAAGSELVDFEQLTRRFRGRTELIGRSLLLFREECASALAELRRRVEAGDFRGAAEVAHRLKGAAGTVSALSVHAAAARVEERCRGGSVIAADGLLTELEREAARTTERLTRTF